MPVADGTVEGKPVSVMRDTGCSTVMVRRSLVPDQKLTCQEKRCILIDNTVRRTLLREKAECFARLCHRLGVCPSVCLSVRTSVTLVICNKTVQPRITRSSPWLPQGV